MICSNLALVRPFPSCVWIAAVATALSLTACGGGSANSVPTGGGTPPAVAPASGEYLWEVSGQGGLYYSTIDATTGWLGSPSNTGYLTSSLVSYSGFTFSTSGNLLYAPTAATYGLETFQMLGPGLKIEYAGGAATAVGLSNYPWSMAKQPAGNFLYVTESGPGFSSIVQTISAVATTGSLYEGPALTENNSELGDGIVDPAGKFLFVGDALKGRIFVYQINQVDGSLTAAAGSPFSLPTGDLPTYVAFGGSGSSLFLYAGLSSGTGIEAFSVNNFTGALTLVPGSPFPSKTNDLDHLCVDPSGKFLYGSNYQEGTIGGFSIDSASGALSPIAALRSRQSRHPWQ